MLAYENEAIFAQQALPAAGGRARADDPHREPGRGREHGRVHRVAQAFLDFLYTPEAQGVFASMGYRPVVEGVETEFDSSGPAGLFTPEDVGGWPEVRTRFFDREESIFLDIENELNPHRRLTNERGRSPARPGTTRRAGGLVLGLSTAYLTPSSSSSRSPLWSPPARGRPPGLLGSGHPRRRRRGPEADRSSSRR